MKRYILCFLLFFASAALCLLLTFWTAGNEKKGREPSGGESSWELADAAADQGEVSHVPPEGRYLLVEKDGMLFVIKSGEDFGRSMHMPVSEFPEEEKRRLKEGIWFSTMMEVYSYLESCTS